jgi:peptide/nickel transport system permease protein
MVIAALLLVLISFLVFSLLYFAPGNIVQVLLGTQERSPETIRLLRREYHLDKPFLTQYWIWAKGAAQLHFGQSIQSSLPVTDEIRSRLPTTLFLGLYAGTVTVILGLVGGIASALKRRTTTDRGIVAVALVGTSTPAFVTGVLLLYLFAVVMAWFPVFGTGSGFFDEVWHLTLPAFALALVTAAFLVKHTRAAIINVLDQDYVTFARARGLSARRVLFLYVLRNALIPVVTVALLIFASFITGAVFVEEVFSLPGLGSLLVQSATTKDLPMIQAIAMLIAALTIAMNLVADLAYMIVDPRIRLGNKVP